LEFTVAPGAESEMSEESVKVARGWLESAGTELRQGPK